MKPIIIFFVLAAAVTFANGQWQPFNVSTNASFRGLSVVGKNVVWASGTGGTVIKTVDGGKNWQVIKVPDAEKLDFRDIEAFDEKNAYVLSIGNGESSRIYKTSDGGTTWRLLFKNENPDAFYDAMAFWDKNTGIAMSDPVEGNFQVLFLMKSGNWSEPFKVHGADKSGYVRAEDGEAAFAASGTCIIATEKRTVFLVSGGFRTRVWRSDNGGVEWSVSDTPMAKGSAGSGIFSIAMRDSKNGIIVGGNYEKPEETAGTLALTNDGGANWTAASGLTGYRSGVAYIDDSIVVAVGTNGSDISVDGGKTWKNLDKGNYNAVAAKGKSAVWAVGPNGLVSRLTVK